MKYENNGTNYKWKQHTKIVNIQHEEHLSNLVDPKKKSTNFNNYHQITLLRCLLGNHFLHVPLLHYLLQNHYIQFHPLQCLLLNHNFQTRHPIHPLLQHQLVEIPKYTQPQLLDLHFICHLFGKEYHLHIMSFYVTCWLHFHCNTPTLFILSWWEIWHIIYLSYIIYKDEWVKG